MDDYEMEESISGELVDRLSELPDSLIHFILSFMSMEDVVITSLLSKRWKNLWATLPYLNFFVYTPSGGEHFVNGVLALWRGTKILKFEIGTDPHFYKSLFSDMDSWLRFAVENKVEDLNIELSYHIQETEWFDSETVRLDSKETVYWAPQCLYSCSSITNLRLVGFNLGKYGSPSWNHLKSLIIDGYCFTESSINLILSGSPRLEVFELRLLESGENLNIASTSLKRLKIDKYLYTNEDDPWMTTVRICCPNLETLEILGALYSKCLFTDVSSLTDATIGFIDSHFYGAWLGHGDKWLEDMLRMQILPSIQHVEKLTLSSWCVQVFGGSKKKHLLSPLQNVKFLKLDYCVIDIVDMINFLGIFPNVEMLVIGYLGFAEAKVEHMEFEAKVSKSFLHQLKTVEITSSVFDSSKLQFFKIFLDRASMLEKLVIRVREMESHEQEHLCEFGKKLQSIPRSSPTAKVLGALQNKYLLSSLPSVNFFPNLKMLVIDGRSFEGEIHAGFERELSKSFMLQLKTIDIALCLPNTLTFWFIEFLLKNASMLEKLVIRVKMVSGDWFKVAEELLCMPRSSPMAKVILKKSSSF